MTRIAIQPGSRSTFGSKLVQVFDYLSKDNEIYQFFRQNVAASYSREEMWVHFLMGALMLVALSLYTLNIGIFHFTTIPLSIKMLIGPPILLMIWWFIGHVHHVRWARFGLVATTCANLGIFCMMSIVGFAAILATPFMIIDYHLVQWDHWLGFDVTTLMAWAHQFPVLIKMLLFSYNTWVFQVLLAPILLAVLKKPKEINEYFIAAAICFVFWILVYYFFPTIAPAGVMHSPYFVSNQYDLVTRYYEVHQFLPISTYEGGMVSFPSGHVMYALLVLVALRKVKIVFYPMLVVNSLLIFATMALGYHYLVDVIASFVIVAFALTVTHFLTQRLSQSLATKNS